MDNFKMSTFFPKSDSNLSTLSTKSICVTNDQIKDNLNIENMIAIRKERKRRIKKQYKTIYKLCKEKIWSANLIGHDFVIYEVPSVIYGVNEYEPTDCITYINKHIKDDLNMDTKILSHTKIFISWVDIEKKS